MIKALIIFLSLCLLMFGYLKVADHFNIIDRPNERSSHTRVTIRGGGIIFVIAVVIWWFLHGFQLPWFFTGFLLISVVSFIDDLGHVPNRVRIVTQFLAVVLLLLELSSTNSFPLVGALTNQTSMVGVSTDHNLSVLLLLLSLPVILGFINAYNFMDGINGITVVNSLVTIGTIAYLNHTLPLIDPDLLSYSMIGLLIFGFFNFRRKAACFAGDVGAVSMAFLITLLMVMLILQTGKFYYLALVFVYGIDSVGTIIERLIKRENIFEAHRSHLYQLMANQSGMPHLVVSSIYGLVQLVVNALIIISIRQDFAPFLIFSLIFLSLVSVFAYAKLKLYRVFG
ncbi:MAG: UDP-GlcNAc--UDP-phosphate GlcNAc-1-phosphate transferase [Cyclobacteriaceae bacterium]